MMKDFNTMDEQSQSCALEQCNRVSNTFLPINTSRMLRATTTVYSVRDHVYSFPIHNKFVSLLWATCALCVVDILGTLFSLLPLKLEHHFIPCQAIRIHDLTFHSNVTHTLVHRSFVAWAGLGG